MDPTEDFDDEIEPPIVGNASPVDRLSQAVPDGQRRGGEQQGQRDRNEDKRTGQVPDYAKKQDRERQVTQHQNGLPGVIVFQRPERAETLQVNTNAVPFDGIDWCSQPPVQGFASCAVFETSPHPRPDVRPCHA